MRAPFLCLLFLCISISSDALKILVTNPAIAPSHFDFHRAIYEVLQEAGHTVHVLMPVFDPALIPKKPLGVAKVYEVHPTGPVAYTEASFGVDPFDRATMKNTFSVRGHSLISYVNTSSHLCGVIINNDEMIAEMKAEKYDVALSEFYDFCFFGIFEAVNVKAKIITSATPINELISQYYGIPSPKSYVTNTLCSYPSAPKLSYLQKIDNLYHSVADYFKTREMAVNTNAQFRQKFGPQFPDIEEIMQNTSLSFVNAAYMLDLPRPTTHKVISIGGINVRKPKESLDPKIEAIFKKAKKGVVMCSFGSWSDPSLMKPEVKDVFIRTFAAFSDYEFIWKFTPANENEAKRLQSYGNIHTVSWLDQTTILNQPKLRAFITHCGLNSLTEAVHAGKPMIAVPLFADQDYNAAIVTQRRVGVYVEIATVDEKTMSDALRQVLGTDEFYDNAQLLKKKILTHPLEPKAQVIKWVEYAAEFNDLHEHLNLESIHMDHFTYFSLDIILPAIFIVIAVIVAVSRGLLVVLRSFSGKRKVD